MQYTENYNLNKPELTDVADITKLSDNMDIIDEELEKRTTKSGFLTDLITHLASDAAIAISSLSTDSVFYRLLSYALNAAGVQYNFTNSSAWYICLGALFGGLIIQGGKKGQNAGTTVTLLYPISFTQKEPLILATPVTATTIFIGSLNTHQKNQVDITINMQNGGAPEVWFSWLSVGK